MEEEKKLICKLCKKDLTAAIPVFRSARELMDLHQAAHFRDVITDMTLVCDRVVKVGWVDRDIVSLAKDIVLRAELIKEGLF